MENTPNQKKSILTERTITEQVLLHPSKLGKLKQSVNKELKKKLEKWDHERQGVLTKFIGRKQILNGGRGRVTDTSHFIQVLVRYTATFARPEVGATIKGTIESITSTNGRVAVMCAIEGGLSAIVREADMTRYSLKAEAASGDLESQSSGEKEEGKQEDLDSVFGDDEEEAGNKVQEVYLEEK